MIEISRTQDEEVGDGTTSVIILGKDVLWLQVITSVCFPRFCIIIGCYTCATSCTYLGRSTEN